MSWAAGEQNLILYADDGQIAGQGHIWVQDTLTVMVAMFWRMGLDTNMDKTKSMVCTTGFIWGILSDTTYKQRATGEGDYFRERKRTWVSCTECGVMIAALLLKAHMERQHGLISPQMWAVDEGWGRSSHIRGVLTPGAEAS